MARPQSMLNKHSMEEKTVFSRIKNIKILVLCRIGIVATMLFVPVFVFVGSAIAASEQKVFATGEEAVSEFLKALREENKQELLTIFGSDANDMVSSGDEVADRQKHEMFLKAYDEQHRLDVEGDKLVLVVGKNDWPFPIPLVKQSEQWVFDTNSGKEEILNRRIGCNEMDTIQVMLAVVDAEREYAMENHDSNGLRVYAQKFRSDPGKKNGLYWETKEGQKPSPLGPFVAAGRQEGYFEKKSSEGPQPYHGYFYKILTAQGENASGGAYDYIVNGEMIGGFAVIAWPADYGNSGIMSFVVNHDGIVYQKDLGEDTEQEARNIKLFDPDKTWVKAQ